MRSIFSCRTAFCFLLLLFFVTAATGCRDGNSSEGAGRTVDVKLSDNIKMAGKASSVVSNGVKDNDTLTSGVEPQFKLTGQAGQRIVYKDSGGEDTYIVDSLMSGDVKLYDSDKSTVILPEGLTVTSAEFMPNGLQFQVNGHTLRIIGDMNNFTFVFAGDPLNAASGIRLSIDDTLKAFGLEVPYKDISETTVAPIKATIMSDGKFDTQPPSVPSNLTAQQISSEKINLSWIPSTDNDEVAGYKIYRGGTLLNPKKTVTELYYDDAVPDKNLKYSYSVTAVDRSGNESDGSLGASNKPDIDGLTTEDLKRLKKVPVNLTPLKEIIMSDGKSLDKYAENRNISFLSDYNTDQDQALAGQSIMPEADDAFQKKEDLIARMIGLSTLYACGRASDKCSACGLSGVDDPCFNWDQPEDENDPENKPAQSHLTYVSGSYSIAERAVADNCQFQTFGFDSAGFVYDLAKQSGMDLTGDKKIANVKNSVYWKIPPDWNLKIHKIDITPYFKYKNGDLVFWKDFGGIVTSDGEAEKIACIASAGVHGQCSINLDGGPVSYKIKDWRKDSPETALRLFPRPELTGITPERCKEGETVEITGKGFQDNLSEKIDENTVYFTGESGPVPAKPAAASSAEKIVVTVPEGAKTGPVWINNAVWQGNTGNDTVNLTVITNAIRYYDDGSGCIEDLSTGLKWKKYAEEGTYTWDDAMYNFGSNMPSRSQLLSIVPDTDEERQELFKVFSVNFGCWSSILFVDNESAWYINISNGVSQRLDRDNKLSVRLLCQEH